MKSLSGIDSAFLYLETPATPMHVASLHLFDLPPGYRGDFHARIKRELARRLHLVPIFQRKLAPMPLQFAGPVWIHDEDVDLDYHVQRVTLPSPGTLAQFEDCAGRLHSELMDRSRPLWRVHVIDGLQSGQVGYYMKAHHAALDGQAAVLLARAMYDLTPRPRAVRRPQDTGAGHSEHPGMAELAAAALRHDAGQYVKLVRHLPDVVRTLAGMFGASGSGDAGKGQVGQDFAFGPRTSLNVPITSERGFSGLSLPLDVLKQLAAVHNVKLNDIMLALCSGTLRRYLAHHGGIPKKPLTAAMPISLRAADNTEYTTQATMPVVNLHSDIADPLRRLRAIRDSASAVKAMVQRARGVVPTDFPVDRDAVGLAGTRRTVRALEDHRRDAAARQRRRLQHPGAAGAALRGRRAHAHLLADVDRRARRGAEHHDDELRRSDGFRVHDGAQRSARRARVVACARRDLRGTDREVPHGEAPRCPPIRRRASTWSARAFSCLTLRDPPASIIESSTARCRPAAAGTRQHAPA